MKMFLFCTALVGLLAGNFIQQYNINYLENALNDAQNQILKDAMSFPYEHQHSHWVGLFTTSTTDCFGLGATECDLYSK